MSFLKTIIFITFAEALIYFGICFLSGQLLPVTLQHVHANWPRWLKLLVFAGIVSIPANLLISWGFRETGPSFAGVVYAGSAIAGAMIAAVLVDGATVRWQAVAAFAMMVLSAAWGIVALRATIPGN